MTQSIPAVANNATQINNAEFVKITIFNEYPYTASGNLQVNSTYIIKTSGNTNWTALGASSNVVGTFFTANAPGAGNGTAANVTVLTFSSSYKPETISGNVYTPLGGLLSVGAQTRNMRVTSGETVITLSGIDGNNIQEVLATNIRGSEVEITRGFYNNNYVLSNSYPRFRGIVTSYGISEDRAEQTDNFTVSVGASSYKTVLENRIAGRKTNKESWQYFNPSDTSMNQVYAISGVTFDFGQTAKAGAVVPGNGGNPVLPRPVGPGCPAPDMRVLMWDYSYKPAAELQPGMLVKTHHEDTMLVGDHAISAVRIEQHPRVEIEFDDIKFICSETHRFYHDHNWIEAITVKPGQSLGTKKVISVRQLPPGDVVRITVDNAHTYIVEGLLSHNKQAYNEGP